MFGDLSCRFCDVYWQKHQLEKEHVEDYCSQAVFYPKTNIWPEIFVIFKFLPSEYQLYDW